MSLKLMAERSAELFSKCFGHAPRWIVAAPGRVNLIGEHTDYNDGFVLPMAIERHIVIAGDRNADQEALVYSMTTGETASFNLRPEIQRGEPAWSNYVRGVAAGFERMGRKLNGFDAVIDSTLPYGGGLASSAALEVAAATLLETITRRKLEPMEKVLLCQRAEHDFAGVPCGIMDQFTSVNGQADFALLLDCRSRKATPVRLADRDLTVMIVNTHLRHKLVEGEYARRRAQCELAARVLGVPALRDATLEQLQAAKSRLDPVAFRRARHVITENERVLQFARAVQASDWATAGPIMYASHASLRDDYEVSCPELDAVVAIAQELGESSGMLGCRMTGAGFGGCAVSLVRTDAVKLITRQMDEAYERKTGNQLSIFSSRPAVGTRALIKAGSSWK
jgi:galactokinase